MLLRPCERRESKANFYSELFPRLAMIFSVLKFHINFCSRIFCYIVCISVSSTLKISCNACVDFMIGLSYFTVQWWWWCCSLLCGRMAFDAAAALCHPSPASQQGIILKIDSHHISCRFRCASFQLCVPTACLFCTGDALLFQTKKLQKCDQSEARLRERGDSSLVSRRVCVPFHPPVVRLHVERLQMKE